MSLSSGSLSARTTHDIIVRLRFLIRLRGALLSRTWPGRLFKDSLWNLLGFRPKKVGRPLCRGVFARRRVRLPLLCQSLYTCLYFFVGGGSLSVFFRFLLIHLFSICFCFSSGARFLSFPVLFRCLPLSSFYSALRSFKRKHRERALRETSFAQTLILQCSHMWMLLAWSALVLQLVTSLADLLGFRQVNQKSLGLLW